MRKVIISTISVIFMLFVVFVAAGIIFTRKSSVAFFEHENHEYGQMKTLDYIYDLDMRKTPNARKIALTQENIKGTSYPLYAFLINEIGNKKILFTGTAHGEEPAGGMTLPGVVKNAEEYVKKNPDLCIVVIPVINPWGFCYNNRYNYDGYNIGVDFTNQKSEEAKSIMKFLDKYQFDIAVDFHESPTLSSYMLVHSDKDIEDARTIIRKLEGEGFSIMENATMKIFRHLNNDKGISYYPRISSVFERLARRETLFVRLKNDGIAKRVFAIEAGRKNDIRKRIQFNQEVIEYYLELSK